MTKRRIILLSMFFLLFAVHAFGATHTVNQDGSGADYSVSGFNALSGTGYAGDTFYFSGSITSAVNPNISGTSGNQVILDGYQAGDCDPINATCSSSAILAGGMYVNNGRDYLTIQDFRFSPILLQIRDTSGGTNSSYITVQRNYMYDMNDRMFMLYGTDHVLVYDNKMVNYGGTTDSTGGVYLKNSNDVVFRANEFGNDGVWDNTSSSDNVFEVHNNDHILWEYNDIHHAETQSGISIKETGNNDIIIRFNKIHDNGTTGDAQGVGTGYNSYNVFVYGNLIYGNGGKGIGIKDGAHDNYYWSNVVVSNGSASSTSGQFGIWVWFGSGRVPGDPHTDNIFIYNNTVAYNSPSTDGVNWTGLVIQDSGVTAKNNLIINNRQNEAQYHQVYLKSGVTFDALDYNTYYHSGGSPGADLFYYQTEYKTLAEMVSDTTLCDHGAEADPGFTDPDGADNTYGTDDDDYTLGGTYVDNAQNLGTGILATVTIYDVNYSLYLDDALDPINTDFTGNASTLQANIKTAKQSENGDGTDRGAYVYTPDAPPATPTIFGFGGVVWDDIATIGGVAVADIASVGGEGSSGSGTSSYIDDPNMMLAYYMNGGLSANGDDETDRSGEGETGVETGGDIPNSATVPSGYSGTSRDFELDDTEWLEVADGGSTDISGANQSISFGLWYRPESLPGSGTIYPISKYDNVNGSRQYAIIYSADTDNWLCNISSDGTDFVTARAGTAASVGTWQHIVCVYNDTDIRIYLNGSLDSNGSDNPFAYTGGIYDGNEPFRIGAEDADKYIDGLIDEGFVFNRALSASEVNDIYTNGISGDKGGSD